MNVKTSHLLAMREREGSSIHQAQGVLGTKQVCTKAACRPEHWHSASQHPNCFNPACVNHSNPLCTVWGPTINDIRKNSMICVPPPPCHCHTHTTYCIRKLSISPSTLTSFMDGSQCLDPSIPCNNCFIIIRAALFSPFILIF